MASQFRLNGADLGSYFGYSFVEIHKLVVLCPLALAVVAIVLYAYGRQYIRGAGIPRCCSLPGMIILLVIGAGNIIRLHR